MGVYQMLDGSSTTLFQSWMPLFNHQNTNEKLSVSRWYSSGGRGGTTMQMQQERGRTVVK